MYENIITWCMSEGKYCMDEFGLMNIESTFGILFGFPLGRGDL